jgi:hypothetical protein
VRSDGWRPVVEVSALPWLVPQATVESLATVEDVLLESKGVHGSTALATRERGGGARGRSKGGGLLETISDVIEASLDKGEDREGSSLGGGSGRQTERRETETDLPVGVARVHELIGATTKPALSGRLHVQEPSPLAFNVDPVALEE